MFSYLQSIWKILAKELPSYLLELEFYSCEGLGSCGLDAITNGETVFLDARWVDWKPSHFFSVLIHEFTHAHQIGNAISGDALRSSRIVYDALAEMEAHERVRAGKRGDFSSFFRIFPAF